MCQNSLCVEHHYHNHNRDISNNAVATFVAHDAEQKILENR